MEIYIPGLPEAAASTGFQLPDPGRYTLRIMGIEQTPDIDKPKLVVTLFVVDGPQQRNIVKENGNNSPVGMQVKEFIPLQKSCAWRSKNLLVAAGVLSRDDEVTTKFDPEAVISQIVTADITHQEYNNKMQANFKYIF
jgi:hypothetical protein